MSNLLNRREWVAAAAAATAGTAGCEKADGQAIAGRNGLWAS
jgi:hypothetical protein